MSDLRAAAEIMDEATSGFTLADYALEGLEALEALGWRIFAPDRDLVRRLHDAERTLEKMAEQDYRGPEPADRREARAYFARNPR